jgi:hypothetical protein
VDVRVMRQPPPATPPGPGFRFAAPSGGPGGGGDTATSLALRKAAVLPGTVRSGVRSVADAGIAWVEAYRRQQWHRVGRLVATGVLLIGGMIQWMAMLSTSY